jgi:hypothetical protein
MDIHHLTTDGEPPSPNATRRLLLAGILSSYVCSYVSLPSAFAGVPAEAASKASENFLALSRQLTGHAQLDALQADRLYAAFLSIEPGFEAQLRQLVDFIAAGQLEAHTLQAALDEQKSTFAKLPSSIASGWYVGVVGSGKAARCVTYETSLMYLTVADRVKPPSYAYGPYGSWGRNPLAS